MPASFVPRRVEDIIFYYYAKLIIAPSAGFKDNYRFIIDTYKRLKSGEIKMSDYNRELVHISHDSNICAFCGSQCQESEPVHVVPRSIGVPPGMQNMVVACRACANSKGEKELLEWWCEHLNRPRDDVPRVPLGLYLKIAYELHKLNFTLKKPCRSLKDLYKVLRRHY